jgi:hypothetical protein
MASNWFIQINEESDNRMGIFTCDPSVLARSLNRPSPPLVDVHFQTAEFHYCFYIHFQTAKKFRNQENMIRFLLLHMGSILGYCKVLKYKEVDHDPKKERICEIA